MASNEQRDTAISRGDRVNYELIRISQAGPVRTVEMNVPAKRNPISFQMADQICEAVEEADRNPDVRVIIIGGAGPVFSGGHDLSAAGLKDYVSQCPTPEDLWAQEEEYFFQKQGLRIWGTDTPTIARVQGAAVLGAFDLANVCDLIVASDDAFFWTPGVRMINFGAELILQPWVMGSRRAKEYLFTGEKMGAEEAYRVGMVNHVVPADELDATTMELAQRIAKNPALGLKFAKRAINGVMDHQGFTSSLKYGFMMHVFGHATTGHQEQVWKPLIEMVEKEGLSSYFSERDKPFSAPSGADGSE